MRAHTKKHPIDEMVDVTLRVRRSNVTLLRRYAEALEAEEKQAYTIAEAFPEYIGREQQVALWAYRHREGLTQKQLAELSGIPQHHISEMENGKQAIGKEGEEACRGVTLRLSTIAVVLQVTVHNYAPSEGKNQQ